MAKGSLLGRMPGDEWKKFANLRLMFGYMFTHPGTKLLFMGGEFGQSQNGIMKKVWTGIYWSMVFIRVFRNLVRDLNAFYKSRTCACIKYQFEHKGFEWIDYSDQENSVMAYQRQADTKEDLLIVICNFTPEVRQALSELVFRISGKWKEVFNSDDLKYAGSGILNEGSLYNISRKISWQRLFDFINFAAAGNFYFEVGEGSMR